MAARYSLLVTFSLPQVPTELKERQLWLAGELTLPQTIQWGSVVAEWTVRFRLNTSA
jgi:hypothetical protein